MVLFDSRYAQEDEGRVQHSGLHSRNVVVCICVQAHLEDRQNNERKRSAVTGQNLGVSLPAKPRD